MLNQSKSNRRLFLKRSGVAGLAALAGPASCPIVSHAESSQRLPQKGVSVDTAGFSPNPIQNGVDRREWEYATIEAFTKKIPVWSLSNLCYIYGAGPDLMPGLVMQQGNQHPVEKIRLKKSWEIKSNFCGAESEMTCRTPYNDSQPLLPIHLIDGDPETAWSSWGLLVPDGRPEWIRIDLPIEAEVASVALISTDTFRRRYIAYNGVPSPYGWALPKELEVRTSRDGWHWDSVYSTKNLAEDPIVEIKFKPHPAKQIWIIGQNFRRKSPHYDGYVFSIASVEVRDRSGNNLALVSRGASVTVSSVCYLELNDRFTEDALWGPLNYDLGNKWLRIGGDNGSFMWHYVEHERGKLELDARADESISLCNQHGVNLIVNLDFKGNWIYMKPPRKTDWVQARFRELNNGYDDPVPESAVNPDMYRGYLRYIEYMTRKLRDRVAYLELGNEWNVYMGSEHYVRTYFEPTYRIVKRIWPEAKIILGSQGGFDQNAILDCLGRERQYGTRHGRLLLNAGDVIIPPPDGPLWPHPERAGAIAVRDGINIHDATVSTDTENNGVSGIILRYKDVGSLLAAIYSAPDRTIACYEVVRGHWGKALGETKVNLGGSTVRFTVKLRAAVATLTMSDGSQQASTTCQLQRVIWPGLIGLIQRAGDRPQLFAKFEVKDGQGRVLAWDNFSGPDGTMPPGWNYVSGGPNRIPKGIASRIDGISWHPLAEPNRAYFTAVRGFQQKCRELGFKGKFFADEIYAGSMYPPGPRSYPLLTSEIQMAKYLVRSLVGHSGLGMEAGPCHPAFTGRVHPQALCQATWGIQTLNPCRPTMAYYMWRNIATMMDEVQPAVFPVKFTAEEKLLVFTFQRGDRERMVSAWIDGPHQNGITEANTDIIFPGVQTRQAQVLDPMNGTRQKLDYVTGSGSTVLRRVLIKDYPVFIRVVV